MSSIVSDERRKFLESVIEAGNGEMYWASLVEASKVPIDSDDAMFEGFLFASVRCIQCESTYVWLDLPIRVRGMNHVAICGGEETPKGWLCPVCTRIAGYGLTNVSVAKRYVEV